MKKTKDDLSQIVYKRVEQIYPSDNKMDIGMQNVLWAIDGKKSLEIIAQEDNYDPDDLIRKAQVLLQQGLIRIVKTSDKVIDNEFIGFVANQLSYRLGPISGVIIEDVSNSIGDPITNFPINKLNQLIDRLAIEINGEEDTIAFKNSIKMEAKRKGYL